MDFVEITINPFQTRINKNYIDIELYNKKMTTVSEV